MTAPVQVGPSPTSGGPAPSPDWDDILADIGDRIRAERLVRGWTQTTLGERSGLSLRTVKRLEIGVGSLQSFMQVCHGLGVDMAHMLSAEWRMPVLPTLTPRQTEILRAVSDGRPLSAAAAELGIPREGVSSHLSRIYAQLGLSHLPRDERRSAALRLAASN